MYSSTQRLMRSRTDKIVAGVSGGIARYLAIDPVFVRLAFVALGLSGVGVVLYPVLWLIMPVEPEGSASSAVGQSDTLYGETALHARSARFDPMTGHPLEEEIPVNTIGTSTSANDVQARRNRILGIVLVSIGAMVVVDMFDSNMSRFVVPAIFVVAGVLLLRRKV